MKNNPIQQFVKTLTCSCFCLAFISSAHAAQPLKDTTLEHKERTDENVQTYKTFYENGKVKSVVWYSQDGEVTAAIRYYGAEGLPPFILSRVEHRFTNMKIFGVTESSGEGGVIYHVILENEHQWVNADVDVNGTITLVNKLKKA